MSSEPPRFPNRDLSLAGIERLPSASDPTLDETIEPNGAVDSLPMKLPTEVSERLLAVCRDVIAPLVMADGGRLYLVDLKVDQISLHLAGTCSGCPGARLTTLSIIEPAIHAVAPMMGVVVSTGFQVPDGASAVAPPAALPYPSHLGESSIR